MVSDSFKYIEKSELIFQGKYLTVEKMQINLPDGGKGEREIVRVKDAAAILPVDENGNVHLISQYRHAVGKITLEVPAGLIDDGETPEQTALRECEEETGYKPRSLREMLYYAHAEGYSSGYTTLFLGTDLVYTGRDNPDSTECLKRITMKLDEFFRLVSTGKIIDSKSILSALLYKTVFLNEKLHQ